MRSAITGLELLGLAKVHQGAIELTQEGRRYAASNLIERKEIFRTQALERCPALAQKSNGRMNREFFVDAMEQSYGVEEAERQVDTLIEWGRYAEIFAYDQESRQLYLEREEAQPGAAPSGD